MTNSVVHAGHVGSIVSYSPSQLSLISRTVAKDLKAEEFDMFVAVCRRVGLDPFRRQIYANVYNKNKPDKRQVVFITAIDGLRAIAERSRRYRPDEEEPVIVYDESLKGDENPRGIDRAIVTVHKRDDGGEWHAIKGVARWAEFAPLSEEVEWIDTGETWNDSGKPKKEKRGTGKWVLDPDAKFWRKMPEHMLAKCAEGQALRKGWPEDMSGLYVAEEMAQANLEERAASELVEEEATQRRLAAVGAANSIPFIMDQALGIESIPMGKLADRLVEHIDRASDAASLAAWRDQNRVGLQEFWARAKSEALEVKRTLEARLAALEKAAPAIAHHPVPEPVKPPQQPAQAPQEASKPIEFDPHAPKAVERATPGELPAKTMAFASEMARQLKAAKTPDHLAELMSVNNADLETLKTRNAKAHARLMELKDERVHVVMQITDDEFERTNTMAAG